MNIEDAIHILKEKGYKHTDKREEILRIFSENHRYLSAKEVLEELKDNFPGMSFDTIYRNLYLYSQLGVLETTEINGEKHFRFSCDTEEHHHHLICLECGSTSQIDTCPMTNIRKQLGGFEITGHKFEIYGRCQQCTSKNQNG